MKSRFLHTAVVILLLATGRMMAQEPTNSAAAAAPPTNAVTRLDLPSFQIISQRNIFDPNRRPRTEAKAQNISKPSQIDFFSLRGTMSYANQSVAFFDGSSSEYSKAVTRADSIAGYKIAEITFNHVKLAAGSNQTINLPVGSQMKRQDNGPWALVENPGSSTDSNPPAASDKSASSTSAGSNAADDVIKRLMQKREQEK